MRTRSMVAEVVRVDFSGIKTKEAIQRTKAAKEKAREAIHQMLHEQDIYHWKEGDTYCF